MTRRRFEGGAHVRPGNCSFFLHPTQGRVPHSSRILCARGEISRIHGASSARGNPDRLLRGTFGEKAIAHPGFGLNILPRTFGFEFAPKLANKHA
jgi:hypothetical protein